MTYQDEEYDSVGAFVVDTEDVSKMSPAQKSIYDTLGSVMTTARLINDERYDGEELQSAILDVAMTVFLNAIMAASKFDHEMAVAQEMCSRLLTSIDAAKRVRRKAQEDEDSGTTSTTD